MREKTRPRTVLISTIQQTLKGQKARVRNSQTYAGKVRTCSRLHRIRLIKPCQATASPFLHRVVSREGSNEA